MSRKTESPAAAAHRVQAQLKTLRSQIDKLDLQILKLINERAELARDIGKLKEVNGNDVFSPAREQEVFDNVVSHNKGPLDEITVRAVYREIISGARAIERRIKIAFLGPEYSFSFLAAVEKFGHDVEFVRVGSIAAVFEEVNRGNAEFGVVPLQNSTDGRVTDTLEMFIRLPQIKISSELRLRVHHNLLANCEQMEIRRVYSKGQALSQCRSWLTKNVAHASLHELASTADAARLALSEPGAAAVASRQAAVRYGLRILAPNIEDVADNETRFAIIGLQPAAKSGKDKTSLMFTVRNNPGSLVDALNVLKANKTNMTWIESYPGRGKNEYLFFADIDGHEEEAKTKKSLEGLKKHVDKLVVIGSYPIADQTTE
jgi:chorismate mutase / prephenate dehydratase